MLGYLELSITEIREGKRGKKNWVAASPHYVVEGVLASKHPTLYNPLFL